MSNYVRAIHIIEGQKIYMPDKENAMKLDKKLKELGVEIRPGRNVEVDIWCIYIISVPEELDRMNCEI